MAGILDGTDMPQMCGLRVLRNFMWQFLPIWQEANVLMEEYEDADGTTEED